MLNMNVKKFIGANVNDNDKLSKHRAVCRVLATAAFCNVGFYALVLYALQMGRNVWCVLSDIALNVLSLKVERNLKIKFSYNVWRICDG